MLSLAYLIISLYYGLTTFKLDLLCFALSVLAMMSKDTIFYRIKSSFMNFLGGISVPMFIIQWFTIILVSNFKLGLSEKIIWFYFVTILVSVITIEITNILRRKN